MKKFLDNLINAPLYDLINTLVKKKEFNFRPFTRHSGFYTTIPDAIRRCYFLTSSEKEVMFELLSWASVTTSYQDGYCKVAENIIRGNTNLGMSTVKKAIKSLTVKGFIDKRRDSFGGNIYKVNCATSSPFFVISELIHSIKEDTLANWSNVSMFEQQGSNRFALAKVSFVEATLKFVNTLEYYQPYVDQMNRLLIKLKIDDTAEWFEDEYLMIHSAIGNEINRLYEEIARQAI